MNPQLVPVDLNRPPQANISPSRPVQSQGSYNWQKNMPDQNGLISTSKYTTQELSVPETPVSNVPASQLPPGFQSVPLTSPAVPLGLSQVNSSNSNALNPLVGAKTEPTAPTMHQNTTHQSKNINESLLNDVPSIQNGEINNTNNFDSLRKLSESTSEQKFKSQPHLLPNKESTLQTQNLIPTSNNLQQQTSHVQGVGSSSIPGHQNLIQPSVSSQIVQNIGSPPLLSAINSHMAGSSQTSLNAGTVQTQPSVGGAQAMPLRQPSQFNNQAVTPGNLSSQPSPMFGQLNNPSQVQGQLDHRFQPPIVSPMPEQQSMVTSNRGGVQQTSNRPFVPPNPIMMGPNQGPPILGGSNQIQSRSFNQNPPSTSGNSNPIKTSIGDSNQTSTMIGATSQVPSTFGGSNQVPPPMGGPTLTPSISGTSNQMSPVVGGPNQASSTFVNPTQFQSTVGGSKIPCTISGPNQALPTIGAYNQVSSTLTSSNHLSGSNHTSPNQTPSTIGGMNQTPHTIGSGIQPMMSGPPQFPPSSSASNQLPPMMGGSNYMPPPPGLNQCSPGISAQKQAPSAIGNINHPPSMMSGSNQQRPMMGALNQPPHMMGALNQPSQMMGAQNQPPQMMGALNQPQQMMGASNQPPQMMGASNQPPQMMGVPNQPPQMMGVPNQPPQMMGASSQPLQMMGGINQAPPMMNSPNQLTNQMQGMHLGQPGRNYPNKQDMLGPHMPPPISAQQNAQYMNGHQSARPGYPQQPPGPGSYGVQPPQGYGADPGGYAQSPYPQQPARKLLPEQMPSPLQVMLDDELNRSGVFYSNQKGLVPPLVTTKFIVKDEGYASPRYLRSTTYTIPVSNDLVKQTSVPLGLVISPMARQIEGEYPPPIVNFGELGPVRCVRCKAYMCPYMQFIDAGRRFQCLFCNAATEVPAEYFQHLDHTGQRMDRLERAELVLGTYEFTATTDYCRNNVWPKPPAIIFVIDVSYNNIKSGFVHLLCMQMKEIISNLPIDEGQEKSQMKVGFITYNSSVHFYNIKSNLVAPQMMIVGDVQDMFMPLLDGFLVSPDESEVVIDALMVQIPEMFKDTRECETVLFPAIVAGLEALKASGCAGKLLVFHSTLPIYEAPGKLKNRDDRKLLGTDKERTVLTPQNQSYNQLGQDCVGAGCSVDLFLFNNAYIDVATLSQVSKLTGGEVYKYTYFQAEIDAERIISDIITNISRPIAFDAVMRVRTSTGVRPTEFYGHCYMANTTDMELASIDCDKAIAVEMKHDDKLNDQDTVYIQVALLYTSVSGQRRLRIINQALKTSSQMADLYRSCDLDTMINFFSKQAIHKLLDNNPKAVKDSLIQRAAQILAAYRKNCASPSGVGQLILPECMKLLPLYLNCMLRSDAISGGSDMTLDDRSFLMQAVTIMDVSTSVVYFYPRLIPLHDFQPPADLAIEIPPAIRCSIENMNDQGVYILENGIHMFLWIGLGANQEFVQKVFGVPSAVQINIDTVILPELQNPLSEAVRMIIELIREQRHRCMRLTLVRQKEKLETVFKHFLVEDHGIDGSPSYVDFLCHMHKEIRMILT